MNHISDTISFPPLHQSSRNLGNFYDSKALFPVSLFLSLFPSSNILTFLSQNQAGVTKSCTVRLNNEIYCIRDGGEWKNCPNGPEVNDLVIEILKLYSSSS